MNQISISKELKNHWIFQNEKYFKWWMLILIEANDEDTVYLYKNELLKVKKGQIMKPLSSWAELFNCHTRTVKKFFLLLQQNDMICTLKNPKRALQPTLIEISLSGCFIQNRAKQSAIQSAIQNDTLKSVRKEPIPEPFSELDDSFKMEEPKPKKKPTPKSPPKPKKEPTATYSKCIAIYYKFYEERMEGNSPKFSTVLGSKVTSIIEYLEGLIVKKNPELKTNKEKLSESITQSFQYIFSNWHKLDDFWQKQIDISVIESKLNTILYQIKNNGKANKHNPNEPELSKHQQKIRDADIEYLRQFDSKEY